MCWEPLAEWGPLDTDFGDLSPPPNLGLKKGRQPQKNIKRWKTTTKKKWKTP
jgi:hypothetical protein